MHTIVTTYITWHFWEVPRQFVVGWFTVLGFALNYFSVPQLLRTFFAPWRRYHESYGKGFRPKRYFEAFTLNTMSRSVGMVLRTVFILLGTLLELVLFVGGLVLLLVWLAAPFLGLAAIIAGIGLLI